MSVPTATDRHRVTRTDRLPGPDVVRGVALTGVVIMNYHGYLILRGNEGTGDGWAAGVFDPWAGPLATRFAATFVLVAGVGVTLMTRSSVEGRHDGRADRVTEQRWRLLRRGLALYVFGLLLDEIWPGTILPFYGAMFVLAAVVFTWRARWLVVLGAAAAVAGGAIRAWRFERIRAGGSTRWLTSPDPGSLRDHVFGVFVNGTHPLLPWFAFFCAGMILGRFLRTDWWRPVTIAAGATLAASAAIAATAQTAGLAGVATSLVPADRSIAYTASALGTSLVAYGAVDWVAERFPRATDPLRLAGQMTLTLYVGHVVVFELLVDQLGWIEPTGLDTALSFSLVFWVVGIASAVVWRRHLGMGPAERLYRALGG